MTESMRWTLETLMQARARRHLAAFFGDCGMPRCQTCGYPPDPTTADRIRAALDSAMSLDARYSAGTLAVLQILRARADALADALE